jgi:hypothetical protein
VGVVGFKALTKHLGGSFLALQMSVKFRVRNIRAVGMHHYGATELQKNVPYTFQWEPMCVYDLGNAIAIHDYRGDIRGYVTREDSAVLSEMVFFGVYRGENGWKDPCRWPCVSTRAWPTARMYCGVPCGQRTRGFCFLFFYHENPFV